MPATTVPPITDNNAPTVAPDTTDATTVPLIKYNLFYAICDKIFGEF